MDATAERDLENRRLARRRLEAESTFRTGIIVREGEPCVSCPRGLTLAFEEVLRIEWRMASLAPSLEDAALRTLIRSPIFDEVVHANELEGAKSSRQQVAQALNLKSEGSLGMRRLRETARIYVELSKESHGYPRSVKEIRDIYDRIMDSEPTSDSLDGRLFRAQRAGIVGAGGQAGRLSIGDSLAKKISAHAWKKRLNRRSTARFRPCCRQPLRAISLNTFIPSTTETGVSVGICRPRLLPLRSRCWPRSRYRGQSPNERPNAIVRLSTRRSP